MKVQLNLKIKNFERLTFFHLRRVLLNLVNFINVQLRKISDEFLSRDIYAVIHEPIFMAMPNIILFTGATINVRMF
jgi:hypothetical protein